MPTFPDSTPPDAVISGVELASHPVSSAPPAAEMSETGHVDAPRVDAPTRLGVALNRRIWRPLLSCSGALALGLALAHVLVRPVAPRTGATALPEVVLPRDTTLIVQAQQPPGALLRGQIQLVADVTGRAPVGGAVARWRVEPGTRVERGDAVLEISSGQAERPAPRAERVQSSAERSQIQAADEQSALAQKMANAQGSLLRAQERVERAQKQVGAARDLVRRLQNGETVASSELPTSFRSRTTLEQATPVGEAAPKTPARPSLSRGATIALQQAQAAGEAARDGARDAQAARQTLISAQGSVRDAGEKLKIAAAAVNEVETRFEAKKATGADVEAARSAQREAQANASLAAKALEGAQAELLKREKSAAASAQYAATARAEAAALGASDAVPTPVPVLTPVPAPDVPAPGAPARVSLEDAARFAGAALDESRRASRDADRIHTEIDNYQRQVTRSRARIESASQNLAQAQQQVLDSVPRPRFTIARAPATGIVTWISRLAREVGAGQGVFGLARGEKVGARFEDKSGLWRNLAPGQRVAALLVALRPSTSTSSLPTSAPSAPASGAQPALAGADPVVPQGEPVTLKVTEIQSPTSEGQAALVLGEVNFSPVSNGDADAEAGAVGTGAASLQAGMEILASVAQKNEKPTLSVPLSALVQRGSSTYLAILTPQTAPTASASPAAIRAQASQKAQAPSLDNLRFRLRWQRVETGRSDGLRQEITAGLAPGMRVVTLPAPLEDLGLMPQVEPDGRDARPQMSSDPGSLKTNEVVVRLTSSSA